MDIFLLIVVIVMAILLLGAMVLVLIVYGHPDDTNQAWFPKIVTVSGMWLSFASLLVLPYDIAAGKDGGSGIRVDILWQIVYVAIAIFIVLLIPYAFFYYESEQDDTVEKESFMDTQAGEAIKYTLLFAVVIIVALVIMYALIAEADVPVYRWSMGAAYTDVINTRDTSYYLFANVNNTTPPLASGIDPFCPSHLCVRGGTYWNLPVSFPLYVIAFVGWLGWFVLTVCGGVGLIALPLDLINDFRTRPKPMSTKQYFDARRELGERAQAMLNLGRELQSNMDRPTRKRAEKRSDNNDLLSFEKHFFFLKKDYQILYIAHKLKGGNPLVPFFKLFLGIISIGISIAWIIHIAIFVLPNKPASPFLNTLFIKLESINGFPLFGVIAFAIFSFYLLMAVVVGVFRFGIRFLIFKMYPMEAGNTLMNAFLFNTWFILIGAIPTTQFCVYAFPYYSAHTTANVMFGSQIRYMKWFRYFYTNNVFIIAMLIFSFFTILVLSICPNNKADQIEDKLDKLAKTKSTSLKDIDDLGR